MFKIILENAFIEIKDFAESEKCRKAFLDLINMSLENHNLIVSDDNDDH